MNITISNSTKRIEKKPQIEDFENSRSQHHFKIIILALYAYIQINEGMVFQVKM